MADFVIDRALVAKLNAYMSTTNGRDKMCRTVQYLSKFIMTYYGSSDAAAKQLKGLSSGLSMARKGFRFFKSLEMYEAILKLENESDLVLRATGGMRAVGYGIYLLYDNWVFLVKSGALLDPAIDAKIVLAYKFWFLGLLSSVLRQLYQAYTLWTKRVALLEEKAGPADAVRKIDASLNDIAVSLAKDFCDMTLPMQQLGWGGPLCPSERLASFCGFISSAIGADQLWAPAGKK